MRIRAPMPTMSGSMSNASAGNERARGSSSGGGTLTTPLLRAVAADICSPDARVRVDEKVTEFLFVVTLQLSREPVGPW